MQRYPVYGGKLNLFTIYWNWFKCDLSTVEGKRWFGRELVQTGGGDNIDDNGEPN